jgi:glutamate dehydrogenase/leucine dehydrogenase
VIWTPYDPKASSPENKKRYLTPWRLMCHGRLIEWIGGEYIGSQDQGVGAPELRWIQRSTNFAIGAGCKVDTGEGTAHGVFAGMCRAALEEELVSSENSKDATKALHDVSVLVVGCGKVGFPLVKLLKDAGARVSVYDPDFISSGIEAVYQKLVSDRGAVTEEHLRTIQSIPKADIFKTEESALRHSDIQIISPNGGPTEWLSRSRDAGTPTRAEVIASTRKSGGKVRIVVGAGNDQVTTTRAPEGVAARNRALETLKKENVTFVPDPAVSPGGVIAVSHELLPEWNRDEVNRDAEAIVRHSTRNLYASARESGGVDSVSMFAALERIVEEESSK